MSEGNIGDLFDRLSRARRWVAAQWLLTLALMLIGVALTGLEDRYVWQVALILLAPLLLGVAALELQAGTVRAFADDDGQRVNLVWGAMALAVWVAAGAACWDVLDWCDDQIPLWATYMTARSGSAQGSLLTYGMVQHGLATVEWLLRWVVLPAKLIPYGASSALWGWRVPWRRIFRFLRQGRWWFGVAAAALVGVWLPSQFFNLDAQGPISTQLWGEGFKLAAAYLLAVGSWVLLLGWWATLFASSQPPPPEEAFAMVEAGGRPPERSRGEAAEIPPPDQEPL